MNKNSVQFKHSAIYGAVFGGIIVFMLLISAIFMVPGKAMTVLTVTVFIFGAYLGTKSFRDKFNDGYITYGKAFGTSLLICVTMGVIWGIYRFILFKYVSPEMMNIEIEEYQEALLTAGWSDSFVELASSSISLFTLSFGYIWNSAIYGSLLSLILAALLKRNINPLLIDTDQKL